MGKNIGKNISNNLSRKYCQKRLDHAKQSTTDALKTASKSATQKATKGTGDLIGKKTANKITKNHHNILQRQLKVKLKYQKIDIYPQKTDSKLLIN